MRTLAGRRRKVIPLAGKWLESYDADPPPRLKRQTNGHRQAAPIDEVVKHMEMSRAFSENAAEINDALANGRPLSKRQQEIMDYMGGGK